VHRQWQGEAVEAAVSAGPMGGVGVERTIGLGHGSSIYPWTHGPMTISAWVRPIPDPWTHRSSRHISAGLAEHESEGFLRSRYGLPAGTITICGAADHVANACAKAANTSNVVRKNVHPEQVRRSQVRPADRASGSECATCKNINESGLISRINAAITKGKRQGKA
jgi:hypothetical protein